LSGYVFDTNCAVRLFPSYGTEPAVIAEDSMTLLKSMDV
jgi:protein SCO1/2